MRDWWRRLTGAPPCLLQSVIVNLKDDPTTAIQGVFWTTHGAWFVLRNAAVLKPGEAPTPADGELIVHRSNVSFLQVDTSR